MKNKENAFLIMAHNEPKVLKCLLSLLDDYNNDIYLHIDKKSKDLVEADLRQCVNKSNIFFIKRMDVRWGHYSQIKCALLLLKKAISKHYDFYHLISGVDLPLKPISEINEFFRLNKGKNFIEFDEKANETGIFLNRVKYYHFFINKIGRSDGNTAKIYFKLYNLLLKLQKVLHIDRLKSSSFKFYKGAQWFSITHDLAAYVLLQMKFIKKHFYFGQSADEMFMQTIAKASPYSNSIVNDWIRYIDWSRGDFEKATPYTFTIDDYDELISSPSLFARKFSTVKDEEIVDKIYNYVINKSKSL